MSSGVCRATALALSSALWALPAAAGATPPATAAADGVASLVGRLPPWLQHTRMLDMALWQWLGLLVVVALTYLGGVVATAIALRVAQRMASRTANTWDDAVIAALRTPLRFAVTLLTLSVLLEPLRLAAVVHDLCHKTIAALLVLVAAWLTIRLAVLAGRALEAHLTRKDPGSARARGIHTLLVVLRRVFAVAAWVTAAALVLTQFEAARNIGRALLASAGIAAMVAGLAAQKSLSNLLAGIQIAVTQPIRVGDTVIVENEWGWIEEITFSYVVIKVWDLRRLVVPINYFLEKPFQNWTKVSPDIMGTVEVHADYTVPVARVRAELERLCKGNPNWDGKVAGLQVTAATDRTVTLRALVSSEDSGKNWDLRCEVREGLIAFLQQLEDGRYLPRTRFQHDAPVDVRASGVQPAAAVH